MNEINLKYNTMPQQVQINKNKIEQLENIIMQPYNTSEALTEETTTIDLSLTSIPMEQPQNILLIDKNGLLFKVAGYSTIENTTTVHIIFWCNLKGVKGERGEQGEPGISNPTDIENLLEIGAGLVGDITEGGDKYEIHVDETVIATKEEVEQIEEELTPINSKLARALLTPMSAPPSDILVGVDTANGQQNITIGDGLTLENGSLKASGGGSYLHNIYINMSQQGVCSLNIINNTPTPFNYDSLFQYFLDNDYRILGGKGYGCFLYYRDSNNNYIFNRIGYSTESTRQITAMGINVKQTLNVDFTNQTSSLTNSSVVATQTITNIATIVDNVIEI